MDFLSRRDCGISELSLYIGLGKGSKVWQQPQSVATYAVNLKMQMLKMTRIFVVSHLILQECAQVGQVCCQCGLQEAIVLQDFHLSKEGCCLTKRPDWASADYHTVIHKTFLISS